MDAKTQDILKAAWAMFARYGFAKTTMSDIATEAGVARQTVYNAFSSKEEILRAVVRHAGEESLTAVKEAWETQSSLEDKVETFQRLGPQSWYEAMQAAPDWGELMDGVHKAAADELKTYETEWVTAIEAMLQSTLSPDTLASLSASEVASFLYTTSKNAKFGAEGLDDLRARLATIRKATLALVQTQK